jgi:hypothetical protein
MWDYRSTKHISILNGGSTVKIKGRNPTAETIVGNRSTAFSLGDTATWSLINFRHSGTSVYGVIDDSGDILFSFPVIDNGEYIFTCTPDCIHVIFGDKSIILKKIKVTSSTTKYYPFISVTPYTNDSTKMTRMVMVKTAPPVSVVDTKAITTNSMNTRMCTPASLDITDIDDIIIVNTYVAHMSLPKLTKNRRLIIVRLFSYSEGETVTTNGLMINSASGDVINGKQTIQLKPHGVLNILGIADLHKWVIV